MWRGRSGISTLIMIEDRGYIVDLGIGSARQFRESGARWDQLEGVFITHMHSDHTLEIPHALLAPWDLPNESYTDSVTFWGPSSYDTAPISADSPTDVLLVTPASPLPGVSEFIDNLLTRVYQGDLNIRFRDEGRGDPRRMLVVRDVVIPKSAGARPEGPRSPRMSPFKVMEDSRVRVTATLVDHRLCFPAFAYRFDSEHGSVVVSGDTAPSPNLIELASGADLLLHEAIHLDKLIESIPAGPGKLEELVEHWKDSHTLHIQVGDIATEADVRQLVLTHICPGHVDMVSNEEWVSVARRQFRGPVSAGNDLDLLTVGKQTRRPAHRRRTFVVGASGSRHRR